MGEDGGLVSACSHCTTTSASSSEILASFEKARSPLPMVQGF